MINLKRDHKIYYTMEVASTNDLLSLINYLENVEINEPIEVLYDERIYTLLVNLTETSNNIKFDNQKREIIIDLEIEDVETWVYRLEVSVEEKEFNPAELFQFKLKGKTIYTYMAITLD